MRRCVARFVLSLSLIVLACVPSSEARAQSSRPRTVALRTLPLSEPIGEVRRILIRGALGHEGEIVLDENRYEAPDRFGDFQQSTTVFYPPVAVQFKPVDIADTTGDRRKVYEIVGTLKPDKTRYYLVSPSRKTGVYRLVVDLPGAERRVLGLEVLPDPPPPSRRVPRIVKIDHAVLATNPPTLVVTVTGQVNTAGWEDAKLSRRVYVTPPADGIWEYDLFATPPTGSSAQVVTKLKASNRWEGFDPQAVKGIRVFGADDGVMEIKF